MAVMRAARRCARAMMPAYAHMRACTYTRPYARIGASVSAHVRRLGVCAWTAIRHAPCAMRACMDVGMWACGACGHVGMWACGRLGVRVCTSVQVCDCMLGYAYKTNKRRGRCARNPTVRLQVAARAARAVRASTTYPRRESLYACALVHVCACTGVGSSSRIHAYMRTRSGAFSCDARMASARLPLRALSCIPARMCVLPISYSVLRIVYCVLRIVYCVSYIV
jgi:hypothetical protein